MYTPNKVMISDFKSDIILKCNFIKIVYLKNIIDEQTNFR